MWWAVREAYLSARVKNYKKPWFLKRQVTKEEREAQLDSFLARHGGGRGRGLVN